MTREPESRVGVFGSDVVEYFESGVVVSVFGDQFVFKAGLVAFIGLAGVAVANCVPDVGDPGTAAGE